MHFQPIIESLDKTTSRKICSAMQEKDRGRPAKKVCHFVTTPTLSDFGTTFDKKLVSHCPAIRTLSGHGKETRL